MIKLPQYDPCPHREGDICIRATEQLGVETPVSPAVCAYTCRNNGGPFCGRPTSIADETKWLVAMLKMTSQRSIDKVVSRYGASPISIAWPQNIDEIVAAYSSLDAYPWFTGIGFSGSAIVIGDHRPRDLDVIIFALDYRAYLRDRDKLVLPTMIGGAKIDTFVKPWPPMGPFVVLDNRRKMLWTSSLYPIVSYPSDVTVQDMGGGRYASPSVALSRMTEVPAGASRTPQEAVAARRAIDIGSKASTCVPCSRRAAR